MILDPINDEIDTKQRPLSEGTVLSLNGDTHFLTFQDYHHRDDPPCKPYSTPRDHRAQHLQSVADTSPQRLPFPLSSLPLRRPDRILDAGRPPPLPDYDTSQAMESQKPQIRGPWFESRRWRLTFYALLVYVTLSIVVGIPLVVMKILRYGRRHAPLHPTVMSWVDQGSYSSPLGIENGVLVQTGDAICNKWHVKDVQSASGTFMTRATHSMSASGSITIRAMTLSGSQEPDAVNGTLRVSLNPNMKAKKATFEIILRSSTVGVREKTNICFLDAGDSRGVLIYPPADLTPAEDITIEVNLLLPPSSSNLKLKKLVTYLPGFSHYFGNLHQHSFETLSLQGGGAEIFIGSIRGQNIVIKNSLASIAGTFNVTQHLELDTIEGSIRTNITLVNESSNDEPTCLNLDTGNSDIQTNISLLAVPKRSLLAPSPIFVASIKTFNGPITVNVTHTTETRVVPLRMNVQNSLAWSNVSIDGKYQGAFDIQTKLSDVIVSEGEVSSEGDPSGLGRDVNFLYDYRSAVRIFGWVGWGTRPKTWTNDDSSIVVRSSLSPVRLQFGDLRAVTRSRR